jgi:hypothetical protein
MYRYEFNMAGCLKLPPSQPSSQGPFDAWVKEGGRGGREKGDFKMSVYLSSRRFKLIQLMYFEVKSIIIFCRKY